MAHARHLAPETRTLAEAALSTWLARLASECGKESVVPSVIELSRVRSWLGLEPNTRVMLAAILILGMGEELWVRFVPKCLDSSEDPVFQAKQMFYGGSKR